MTTADALRAQIAQKRLELQDLESRLEQLEQTSHTIPTEPKDWKWPLLPEEYNRYSRQMIVPNFGLQGLSIFTRFFSRCPNHILQDKSAYDKREFFWLGLEVLDVLPLHILLAVELRN